MCIVNTLFRSDESISGYLGGNTSGICRIFRCLRSLHSGSSTYSSYPRLIITDGSSNDRGHNQGTSKKSQTVIHDELSFIDFKLLVFIQLVASFSLFLFPLYLIKSIINSGIPPSM